MKTHSYLDEKTLKQLKTEHPEISSKTWHKVAKRMAGGLIRISRIRYGGADGGDTKSVPTETFDENQKTWVSPDLIEMGILIPEKVEGKSQPFGSKDITETEIKEVQEAFTGNTDQIKESLQNFDVSKLSVAEKKETLEKIELQRQELIETENEMKDEIKLELGSKWKDAWTAFMALAEVMGLFMRKSWESIWSSIKYLFEMSGGAGQKLMTQVVSEDSFLRRMLNKVGTGIKIVGNAVWLGIKAIGSVVTSLFPSAVSVALWISSNPQTSRMTLIMLRLLKRKLCKEMGLWWTTSQEERLTHKLEVEDISIREVGSELKGPILANVASNVLKSDKLKKGLDVVGKLVTKSMESIPFVGGLLSGITEIVYDTMTDSALEAANFMVYWTSVTENFKVLLDLLDPKQCMSDFQKQAKEATEILNRATSTRTV